MATRFNARLGVSVGITPTDVIDANGSITANTLAVGNTTLSGSLNLQDNELIRPIIRDYGLTHNALGSGSGSRTIDLTLGNFVSATVTGTTTWTFSNPTPSSNATGFVLELVDGGSATQNWPTPNVKWPGGTAPTLTASGVDVLAFFTDDGGTTWRGVLSMADSK